MSSDFHAITVEEAIQALKSSLQGLSEEEAKRRLEEFGFNELRERKRATPLGIFLGQFKNFLILILLAAVAISVVIGEIVDASVIFGIVIACTVLGFVQEYRAERALEALKRLAAPTATVMRDGVEREIPARELVPGDIILLTTGDRVPADARLQEQMNLQVDEAPLTGESVSVSKETGALTERVAVPDRRNTVFAGTIVTYGRGRAVVTSTGMSTQFGKIAEMIQAAEERETPLGRRLDHVGRWLGVACLVVCAIVTALGILRGYEPLEMFIWGVSLAVAAVPEALPAVVTGALAIGVQRMARRNAVVRKLPAVETLGCTTVICTDKTGTLTKNEMTVRVIYTNDQAIEVTGVGYEPRGEFHRGGVVIDPNENDHIKSLLKIAVLCNDARLRSEKDAWRISGDPTEGALIVAAAKAGMWQDELKARLPRIGEVPFSSERKRMSTIHSTPEGARVACVKGAPELVLERCTHIHKGGQTRKLTKRGKRKILEINEEMAGEGLRLLGMAYRELPETLQDFTEESIENNLIFVGLMGMIDPPREEAKQAVRLCEQAGIRPVMITGDHKLTAIAVAKELGILKGGLVLTGAELDGVDDEELERMAEDVEVYARVSPMHKIRIVKALKKWGHVVAMTGDGVNDAPALKNADVGVAMGITGTDVTKEASDMVLADDNFASIVAAVEEGRGIYDNIGKYLAYLLSANIGEVLIMLAAFLLFPFPYSMPLVALQILWINLVTDGLPALALGVDPADPGIMQRPPRDPRESVFSRRMKIYFLGYPALMCVAALLIYHWTFTQGDLMKARTLAFTTIMMFEMFDAQNVRSFYHSVFKIGVFSNKYLVYAIISSILLQIAVVHVPAFQHLFGTAPLSLFEWGMVTMVASTALIAMETGKIIGRRGSHA